MKDSLIAEFSESDVRFLVETVNPALLSKMDTIKHDPDIIEGMLEHQTNELFQRIMVMSKETIIARITPRFLFEILLRTARKNLENQAYTVERTASQRIPVFDTPEVLRFLNNKIVLKYLADMLVSFTHIESFTLPVRVRKGIWRKIRFNDMDIDSLVRFSRAVDEERRFGFYKRIADLSLFILGMFPEYITVDYRYSVGKDAGLKLFGRHRRSAEEYEEIGRRFYKLAGEHEDAALLDLTEVLQQFHDNFNLAKKPLNYISEHFIQFHKDRLFPSLSS